MDAPRFHVLCPLDGTEHAETALTAVMPLVLGSPSRVTLLRVLASREEAIDAESYLEKAAAPLRARDIPTQVAARQGSPTGQILAYCHEASVDLIAVAIRKRIELSRWVRASVAVEVIRHAEVPVLVCRMGQRLRDWKRILVPLDETVSAQLLITDVTALAHHTGGSVELLQAVLPAAPIPYGSDITWMQSYGTGPAAITPLLKELSGVVASAGVEVHPARRWLLSASGIADRASEGHFDLICMTTHGRTGLPRFFLGSLAEDVLQQSPCPVYLRRVLPGAQPSAHLLQAMGAGGI
jgi:nucleotide-binding universal stress UspA family protein